MCFEYLTICINVFPVDPIRHVRPSTPLFNPIKTRGHIVPPCRVFVYIRANTRTTVLKKTFPKYEFGKGQCTFYPMKLSRFGEKKK